MFLLDSPGSKMCCQRECIDPVKETFLQIQEKGNMTDLVDNLSEIK